MAVARGAFLHSAALFSVAASLIGCACPSALLGNQLTFSALQVQRYLDRRYPP
jgi:hypothetical protein